MQLAFLFCYTNQSLIAIVQGKLNEAYEAFSEAFTILQQVRFWVYMKQMFLIWILCGVVEGISLRTFCS